MEKNTSRKVGLKQIAAKAIADAEFWTALRKDPAGALQRNRMALDSEDYERLTAILALDGRTLEVDLNGFMERVRAIKPKGIGDGLSWLVMWPPEILEPGRDRSRKR